MNTTKKKNNVSNFQLQIGIIISSILIVFYVYYINQVSVTHKTFHINVENIDTKKEKLNLIVPFFKKHLEAAIFSEDKKCIEYLDNRKINIFLKTRTNYAEINKYNTFDLYNLKYGDKATIEFSANRKLDSCNINIKFFDTALDLFMAIILKYIPMGLLILSIIILFIRIRNKGVR